MAPKIGIIPSNDEIGERFARVAKQKGMGEDLIFKMGVGPISRTHAIEFEREGVDVIITRGINVDIVRNTVQTPVIEIPVTGQDLAKALHEAKMQTKLERPRIAILAFSEMRKDVQIFATLLDIDLKIYSVMNDYDYIRQQISLAIKDGAHVMVAGNISGKLAREQGLKSLMLDSGEVAVRTALHEAQTVAYARQLEKVRTRRLQAVADVSSNGIFVIDKCNNIKAVNVKARAILNLKADGGNTKIELVLPEPLLSRCISCEAKIVDELIEIHGASYLLNSDLVKMGDHISDVIFTLQPLAAISELESKLRKSLHARGLTCHYSFADIWGASDAIKSTVSTARSYAATDSPVLLMGETGTGKELFAQAIHQASPFACGPFVAINCAALPPSLLESELFGHEEGAFTGARRNGKPGLFEIAHNGTIFLDEISEMNHYGQTRLLRVLQERCAMRIGGDKYVPVTARVIAASNQNLPDLVERKRFRRDLFYRLNVLPLVVPPLRHRIGDIALLAHKFAGEFRKKYGAFVQLTPEIIAVFEKHEWPGNIRELSGILERLTLLARTDKVTLSHVKAALRMDMLPVSPEGNPKDAHPERDRIKTALAKHNGHQGRAAKELGMHRSTLLRKMRAFDLKLHKTPL